MARWFHNDNLQREVPTPPPDGTVTVFCTSKPFKAGSLAVFVNGHMAAPVNPITGFLELGDHNFVMNVAPGADDTLQVIYEAK